MILDKFKLDGKVALVTGAAKGLGQAMTLGLAEAGADICAIDRNDSIRTCESVQKLGRRCLNLTVDLADRKAIAGIAPQALDHFGRLNILVNNAGIIRRSPFTGFTAKDWDEVIDINLSAVFFLSQAVAGVFIKQGRGGKIINVASMLSFQGGILVPSYTAAKSGVMGLTRLMANELAPHNINVNAIAPGYMATENTAALRSDSVRNKAILERIPAGRWGQPEDLKGIVVFLASDASAYLQGYTVAVDGGWLAR